MNEPDELLRAAQTGAARCLSHGHRFEGTSREPVVVERPGGNHEVFCRSCAEHYGETIVRETANKEDSDK